MLIYRQFDVVVVPFPFTDSNKTKRRPALVLSSSSWTIDKSIMAMITTSGHSPWPLDMVIKDLGAAGINSPSKVRFKLFTLDNDLIIKQIGTLSKSDRTEISSRIKSIFEV
ncbi:MAG: type II toxin-antitoxin system PemK/MazF family toxin [Cyanobacteria bacterium J06642_3]